MLEKLLLDVEEIINTLACNEAQTIEVRGSFNAAINLRAMMEQINPLDMPKPKEEKKEEPTRWTPPAGDDSNKKGKE